MDLTKKQANALERLTMGDKIPRKLKKKLKKEAEGYVPKKRPRRISEAMKANRKENRKAAKEAARVARETKMVEHLVKSGWRRSGPMMDVWTLPSWKDGYFEDCKRTLHKAYKIQLKLDSEGYERPAGIDDAIEL